jgi:cation diffusion facilitator family transporter
MPGARPCPAEMRSSYAQGVARVLWVILALNLAVAVAKLVVGWRADSLAVIGDGLHSLVDAVSNVVGLTILRVASQPADEDHPFGHAKYETVAALVLAGLMLLTAFELGQIAFERIVSPHETSVEPLTIGVMVGTLAVNGFVAWAEAREGRKRGSEVLLADAAHTRADVLVTIVVLAGLGLQRAGVRGADPILALGVALFIVYTAWSVLRHALPVLTDAIALAPGDVARVVRAVPGVVSVHDIRSRRSGHEAFVQMHLVVDAVDVAEAHRITDEVERRVSADLGVKEVFIHVEPEDDASGPPGSRG